MSKLFLIADTHFGDDAIRRYENRPFGSAGEMDEALIRNWNQVVSPEDHVYHLGDFSLPGREEQYLRQLKGHIYLVRGNHDLLGNAAYRSMGFEESYDLPVVLEQFWILSHEPMYVNENMPYANLFGHVHGSPLYKTFSSHHYCVSVERIGYTPITLEQIKEEIGRQMAPQC